MTRESDVEPNKTTTNPTAPARARPTTPGGGTPGEQAVVRGAFERPDRPTAQPNHPTPRAAKQQQGGGVGWGGGGGWWWWCASTVGANSTNRRGVQKKDPNAYVRTWGGSPGGQGGRRRRRRRVRGGMADNATAPPIPAHCVPHIPGRDQTTTTSVGGDGGWVVGCGLWVASQPHCRWWVGRS